MGLWEGKHICVPPSRPSHKLVANDLEAPYVETGTKCYVDFGQKRGQSVTEARSKRHFTMAAALVAAKTKSAPRAPKC